MAGAPIGNTNGTKQKRVFGDCIRREAAQRPEDILRIVRKAIEQAQEGDAAARSWLAERCDGKAPQPVVGDDDSDPISIKELVIRAIDATSNRSTEESE